MESGKGFEYDIKALQDMTGGKYQKNGPANESRRGSNKRGRDDDRDQNESFDQYDVTQKRPARTGSSESLRRDRSPVSRSRDYSREKSPRRDYSRERSPPRRGSERGDRDSKRSGRRR